MANYLKMQKRQHVTALLELGWSYRRIQRETGVRRETISRHDQARRANAAKVFAGSDGGGESPEPGSAGGTEANPAKVFAGSGANAAKVFAGAGAPPRSTAAPFEAEIRRGVDAGLTAQRIWQDLVAELAYSGSYESVKRFVRRLAPSTARPATVLHAAPGEEAQVDFFQGAPTFHPERGLWRRPWIFRMTLSHSRHGYEEAVWDQRLETFLRLHERAFADFGGVPQVVRLDNLRAGVARACWHDPDLNPVFAAFAEHWGFTALPIRPRRPQENGKQERAGGYVKDNALKGRRFSSLAEQNQWLRQWNRTIARLRIHGTTRRQVWTHFLETDKPALLPLASQRFCLFTCGTRRVHPDGHVEVEGAYYPVPPHLLARELTVRWDDRLVRLYVQDPSTAESKAIAVHARVPRGEYASAPGEAGRPSSSQLAFRMRLLTRAAQIGPALHEWAEKAIEARGVRALRVVQGVLALSRVHPRERLLWAARLATENHLFRTRDLRRLVDQKAGPVQPSLLLREHAAIRSMTEYRLEDLA